MWDGKFSSLHAQTLGPILNPNEMGLTTSDLTTKLNSIPAYVQAFNQAYSQPPDIRNFKVPTLRNIALTAPYMHDASLATLEAVIVKYNLGSLNDSNRAVEIKPLNLSAGDIIDLAEFLRGLSSPINSVVPGVDTSSSLKIEQYIQGL